MTKTYPFLLGVTLLSLCKGTNSNAFTKQCNFRSNFYGLKSCPHTTLEYPIPTSVLDKDSRKGHSSPHRFESDQAYPFLLGVTLLSLCKGTNSNAYTKQCNFRSNFYGLKSCPHTTLEYPIPTSVLDKDSRKGHSCPHRFESDQGIVTLLSLCKGTNSNAYTKQCNFRSNFYGLKSCPHTTLEYPIPTSVLDKDSCKGHSSPHKFESDQDISISAWCDTAEPMRRHQQQRLYQAI